LSVFFRSDHIVDMCLSVKDYPSIAYGFFMVTMIS